VSFLTEARHKPDRSMITLRTSCSACRADERSDDTGRPSDRGMVSMTGAAGVITALESDGAIAGNGMTY